MTQAGNNPSEFTGDNLPEERVSWNDVQGFITKLNRMTRLISGAAILASAWLAIQNRSVGQAEKERITPAN